MAIEKPNPTAQQHAPICPRCGYDQSGTVASWTDRCPMTGRCSECGLEFDWRQVLAEQVIGPPWSVEHGLRLTPRRLARAYAAGLWHRRLWKRFELVGRVRPRRLAAFAAATMLFNHVLLVVIVTASTMVTRSMQWGSWSPEWGARVWLLPYFREIEVPTGPMTADILPMWPLSFLVGSSLVAPTLLMFVFTQSMSRVGVRPVHIWRGAAYMLPAMVPGLVVYAGVFVLMVVAGPYARPGPDWVLTIVTIAVLLSWPIVQVLRWRAFARHYLRLPHSNWIALSMAIITVLVFMVAALTVGPYLD